MFNFDGAKLHKNVRRWLVLIRIPRDYCYIDADLCSNNMLFSRFFVTLHTYNAKTTWIWQKTSNWDHYSHGRYKDVF